MISEPHIQLISGSRRAWLLHGHERTRAVEQIALTTQAQPHALMARAGFSLARLGLVLAPHARQADVLVGPGNNGGDGLVAALHLHNTGWQVRAHLIVVPDKRPADAQWALEQAQAAGVHITSGVPTALPREALVIDALLGLGSRHPPQGEFAAAIRWINQISTNTVLAVDLPSGLDADSGSAAHDCTVKAQATLALLSLKPGLFMHQGRDYAGQVWLDTLGVAVSAGDAELSAPVAHPERLHASHKGSHGDVLVVGGAMGMRGAAQLAAQAALAAGAGRVYVHLLGCPFDAEAGAGWPPELMQRLTLDQSAPVELARLTVIAGCGGGAAVASALPLLLSHAGRLVLDADALNAIARDDSLLQLLQWRTQRDKPTVLTPHPLEAARLLGRTVTQVQQQRLRAACELAERTASCVLLKGSGTVIAAPGLLPRINPTGNAALAGPGSGDVLAGWLAGLWSQGPSANSQQLATTAAWEHGAAADAYAAQAPNRPLRATQLIEWLMRPA